MKREGNVIYPHWLSKVDLPPERVLKSASEAEMSGVVVLGYTEDGDEFFASSIADGATVLWLLERCKKLLLDAADEIGA